MTRRLVSVLFAAAMIALPAYAQVELDKFLMSSPANLDMPETYQLRIAVPSGAPQLTSIGPVVDTLPPGAVFNGATPAADCQPGCVGTTPATLTWTSPCTTPLNGGSHCVITVNVTFPSATYPSGTSVTNVFTAEVTPFGGSPETMGPASLSHSVTTFVPSPSARLDKRLASPFPTIDQSFTYEIEVGNDGNVALDGLTVIDVLPIQIGVDSVRTGRYSGLADFAVGEGVRVRYEKNTAPGIFVLWGSSPNTATNTTLTAPPPGLGAGEYITRLRWEYGQALGGMAATTAPTITGRIINPSNVGGPVAIGDTIQNCVSLSAVYTAGPTNVNRNDCTSFAVRATADVSVTKGDGSSSVIAGTTLAYMIEVTNTGPHSATDLTLTDTLSAGTTFVSLTSPAGWSCTTPAAGAGGTISCSRSSLPIGSAIFTLTVAVDPAVASGSMLTNTASVATSAIDSNSANDSGTVMTTVTTAADLQLAKSATPDPVVAGETLAWTIDLANAGPSNAANVTLSDVLPVGASFLSLTAPAGWSCTTPAVGAGGTISCSIASLAPGSGSFTLVGSLDPALAAGTIVSNTATVASATTDPTPGDESSTVTVPVATSADLGVTKSGSPDPVSAGENLIWTIEATNAGPSEATAVTLDDTLPAGTTFFSLAAPTGWSCTTPAVGGAGAITCSIPSFGVTSASFTVVGAVDADVASGSPITNTVTVSSATADPTAGNDISSATTPVETSADLAVTKSAAPDPVSAGENLTWTIEVTNAGPSEAAAVTLDDTLPVGTTFVSLAAPAGWSCTTPAVGVGGTISCSVASLAPGSGSFTLVGSLDPALAAGTIVSNTATVASATTDPTPGNESSTVTVPVATSADLGVTKSGSPDPVSSGENLTWTIEVTNAGPSEAAAVTLDDTLPVGTTFVSLAAPAGWSCTIPAVGGAGAITCSIPSLGMTSASFTLVAAVDADIASGSSITNTATVISSTADPNGWNDSSSATAGVQALADLSIDKTAVPDTVFNGFDVVYTLVVTNPGPSFALDVTLTDALPAEISFLALTAPAGWSCTTPAVGSTGTITCTHANLSIGAASFTLTVTADPDAAPGTTLTNSATISSPGDSNAANDTAAASVTVAAAPTAADIVALKSGATMGFGGMPITYAIEITNGMLIDQGDNPGPEFVDVLPAELVVESASATSGTVVADIGANTVTWDGAIPSGGSVTITIVAMIGPDASGPVANQGSLLIDLDGDGTNETTVMTRQGDGTAGPTVVNVQPASAIPVLSPWMLIALAAILAVAGMGRMRA